MTENRQQAQNDENSSGRRLEQLLAVPGRDLGWLAKRTEIPRTTLSDYQRRGIKDALNAISIARELGVQVEWLMTGKGGTTAEKSSGAVVDFDSVAEERGLIKIEEVDISVGMGSGYIDEAAINAIPRWMPVEWVRRFTDAPASMLGIAQPFGDSMYPTINDRDIILFDRSKRSIDRQDAIWVLVYGGLGTIKRVRAMPDGSYKLMGDNPQVREETAHDDEMFVIGRVVGVIRRT